MTRALGVLETTEVVGAFLCENFKFWTRVGKTPKEAIELAIKDADGITRDPFSPAGRPLDDEAARETADIWRELMHAKLSEN